MPPKDPTPTPAPTATPDPIDSLIKSVFANVGGGASTPYKGTSHNELAKMYKDGEITEEEFRAELMARVEAGDLGQKTADNLLAQTTPTPGRGIGQQVAGTVNNAVNKVQESARQATSLEKLSEKDILDGIKKKQWTSAEAYQRLISDKGYSPAAARSTVANFLNEDTISPEYKAVADDLKAKGIGPKSSAQNILDGIKKRLWSPDDAFKALIVYGGMDPTEAQAQLRLYFGIQGPLTPGVQFNPSQRSEITPPSVGSAGLAAPGGGLSSVMGAGGGAGKYDQSSVATLYDAGRKAGFSGDALDRIVATALAESGGNLKAHNTSGEDSRGPLQINVGPGAHPQLAGLDLYDPYVAMQQAYNISSGGKDFSPWTVWHQDRGAPAASIYQQLVGQQQPAAPTGGVQFNSAPPPAPMPVAAGVRLGGPLDESNLKAQYG